MLILNVQHTQDDANPEWAEVNITSGKLCNGDWNRKLRFEIFDHDTTGSDDYIGAFDTTLEEVMVEMAYA